MRDTPRTDADLVALDTVIQHLKDNEMPAAAEAMEQIRYRLLEHDHFGCPDAKTGIYASRSGPSNESCPKWFLETIAGPAFTREECREEAKHILAGTGIYASLKNAAPQVGKPEREPVDASASSRTPAVAAPHVHVADDNLSDYCARCGGTLMDPIHVSFDATRDSGATQQRGGQ